MWKSRSATSRSMPLLDHAVHQARIDFGHPVARTLVAHRAAQLVGLAARKAGGFHRHAHPLLLKERHAERAFENRFERGMRIRDRFHAVAPAQERMDHVALNRARTNDRDLHDDVVETLRLASAAASIAARATRLGRRRSNRRCTASRRWACRRSGSFRATAAAARDNSAYAARTHRARARACRGRADRS